MASTLDLFRILERSSHSEAHLVLAVDLREVSIQDIEAIAACTALQVALLTQNLLSSISPSIFACRMLRKLDISRNGITSLPTLEQWSVLGVLQILYLHDNHLAALQSVGNLASCQSLLRLTLFGNPCSRHPSYRHYCVNTLLTLRALDLNVVSDEEVSWKPRALPPDA